MPETNAILVIAPVPIDAVMLGPGLRYWELACELSRRQPVTLLTPNESQLTHERFSVRSYADPRVIEQAIAEHPVVILQGFTLFLQREILPALQAAGSYIAVDLYTPLDLEGLELRPDTSDFAIAWNLVDLNTLREQIKIGDFFFCASERQRDYWLGMLSALGRLNPHTYWDDRTARRLIEVVPFGLPAEPAAGRRPVLKGIHPRIAPTDRVMLWFGGLWNWLDPEAVIAAFSRIAPQHPDARLVFVTRMPADLAAPGAAAAKRALDLSRELGLYDDKVLFCETVPFDDRQDLLCEADIGLCYNAEHLEARFSFRTRLLDYIWAGLPIITGRGDVLGELVEAERLGYAVPPADVKGLASAMSALLAENDARGSRLPAFARVRERLTWEKAVAPLRDFCRNPRHAADQGIAAYAPYRSADWERLVIDKVENEHRVTLLRRRVQEQEAVIEAKDAYIHDLLNGRVMRLMVAAQGSLRKLRGQRGVPGSESEHHRETGVS